MLPAIQLNYKQTFECRKYDQETFLMINKEIKTKICVIVADCLIILITDRCNLFLYYILYYEGESKT